ncbi:MAG: hypothetical protein LUQ11_11285 [Methylococcaceae bacterium]|nr:hypothetical protein [Methylococcaceae bacterium]
MEEKGDFQFLAESATAPIAAACHGWAFFGATAEQTSDPAIAYVAASPFYKDERSREAELKIQLDALSLRVDPKPYIEMIEQLEQSRTAQNGPFLASRRASRLSDSTKAHQEVLKAFAKAARLAPSDAPTDVELLVYWDEKDGEFMYRHFEIEYCEAVCYKKFNGGQVAATTGTSELEASGDSQVKSTRIYIDPDSLTGSHKTYIAEIATRLESDAPTDSGDS